jgi:hypothetical protein
LSAAPQDLTPIPRWSPRVDAKTNVVQSDLLILTLPGRLPSGPETSYGHPSTTILKYLYDPAGLNVPKLDVFHHWGLSHFYCLAPGGYYDDGKSNCEQTTPKLPQ